MDKYFKKFRVIKLFILIILLILVLEMQGCSDSKDKVSLKNVKEIGTNTKINKLAFELFFLQV